MKPKLAVKEKEKKIHFASVSHTVFLESRLEAGFTVKYERQASLLRGRNQRVTGNLPFAWMYLWTAISVIPFYEEREG